MGGDLAIRGEGGEPCLPALIDSVRIGEVVKILAGGAGVGTPGHHEVCVWQTPSTQVMAIKLIDLGVTPRGSTNSLSGHPRIILHRIVKQLYWCTFR